MLNCRKIDPTHIKWKKLSSGNFKLHIKYLKITRMQCKFYTLRLSVPTGIDQNDPEDAFNLLVADIRVTKLFNLDLI